MTQSKFFFNKVLAFRSRCVATKPAGLLNRLNHPSEIAAVAKDGRVYKEAGGM